MKMERLSNNDALISLTEITDDARSLIDRFNSAVKQNLQQKKFLNPYTSIDDILILKYNLKDIDKLDFPDYCLKTGFITTSIRGNLSKADGRILTYSEARQIIDKAFTEVLP
ncbi:MAG: hypothetical protein J7497_12360 [Chitinophagaceae bacterium]|nr:hypothetical protein [Chitinophagaceae bacterium]